MSLPALLTGSIPLQSQHKDLFPSVGTKSEESVSSSNHVHIRVSIIVGNIKQHSLLQAHQSGQSAVTPFSVAHKVKHPATSMQVMMHHDNSPINTATTGYYWWSHHPNSCTSPPSKCWRKNNTNYYNICRLYYMVFRGSAVHKRMRIFLFLCSIFSAECIWKRMYCDCYHSREMQYIWSSLAFKESAHQGKILHNFSRYSCHSCGVNRQTSTNQFWHSHVDVLISHFPNHDTETKRLKVSCLCMYVLMFSRPPTSSCWCTPPTCQLIQTTQQALT